MATPQTVQEAPETKPNGPVAAAFLAAGVGSFVLGLFVVLNELSPAVNEFLRWDENFGLGSGVGPLSGKAGMAIVAFVVSWVILHLALRRREVRWSGALAASLILVGLGFLLTFPPVFVLFASE